MLLDLVQPYDYFALEGQAGVVWLEIRLCVVAPRLSSIHRGQELGRE
jgi:hypothetical protein